MDFSLLPMDICMEIFARVSIKSLLKCRCVCKKWLLLLQDSRLPELHLLKTSPSHTPNSLILYSDFENMLPTRDLYYLDLEESACRKLIKIPIPFKEDCLKYFTDVSSCNGLLCLDERIFDYQNLSICNPSTGDYVLLPQPDFPPNPSCMMSGFGFDTVTSQYKVVRIMIYAHEGRRNSIQLNSKVYTLGTAYSSSSSSWRSVGNGDRDGAVMQFHRETRSGLYVAGDRAIYWKGYRIITHLSAVQCLPCLISFNLGLEELQILQLPSGMKEINLGDLQINLGNLTLVSLEGRLSVLQMMSDGYCMKVWVSMNGSWTVQRIIEDSLGFIPGLIYAKPLCFNNKGEVIFFCGDRSIVAYDLRRKRHRFLCGIMDMFVLIPHVGSLISPRS